MISIVIIDDHPVFAEGLASLLNKEKNIYGIHIFNQPEQFFSTYASLQQPVIVLLDINLGKLISGIDVCKEIKCAFPSVKVIGLSMYSEARVISEMMKMGASGYLNKNVSYTEIIEAIAEVANGKNYLSKEIRQFELENSSANELFLELNPREKKVLAKVVEGKTNREIAELLNISIKTVEYYRNSIFIKFDVKNSIELLNKLKKIL